MSFHRPSCGATGVGRVLLVRRRLRHLARGARVDHHRPAPPETAGHPRGRRAQAVLATAQCEDQGRPTHRQYGSILHGTHARRHTRTRARARTDYRISSNNNAYSRSRSRSHDAAAATHASPRACVHAPSHPPQFCAVTTVRVAQACLGLALALCEDGPMAGISMYFFVQKYQIPVFQVRCPRGPDWLDPRRGRVRQARVHSSLR